MDSPGAIRVRLGPRKVEYKEKKQITQNSEADTPRYQEMEFEDVYSARCVV
jgi:hypothetical protein